jgi:hypothetical protein
MFVVIILAKVEESRVRKSVFTLQTMKALRDAKNARAKIVMLRDDENQE